MLHLSDFGAAGQKIYEAAILRHNTDRRKKGDFFSIWESLIDNVAKDLNNRDSINIRLISQAGGQALNVWAKTVVSQSPAALMNTTVDLLQKKGHDYGYKSLTKFGHLSFIIRTSSKIERLKNLWKDKKHPKFESIFDTLMDIVGYSILYILYLEGKIK